MELDPLPVTWRTALFSLTHTFTQVCHPRKGRVPREELGTRGQHGVPAMVPPQMQWVRVSGTGPQTYSPGGSQARAAPGGKSLALADTSPPCPEAAPLDPVASTL